MVPGLTERAAHAAEAQTRDWLAEVLREQARRDSLSMPSREIHRSRLATVGTLRQGSLAIGRRGVGELVAALSSRRRSGSGAATEAVPDALPGAAPFPAEAPR